ncbi:MAG: DNA alkylation repair protein [bacterium]|nr:DNA alkylation repair protein [bacterium]
MEHGIKYKALIQKHQAALDSHASEKTRVWWERYMKGVIPFRGVGIPKNRALLTGWRKEHGIDQWSLEQQFEIALAFFQEPMAEDKLAGILFLQNFLCEKLPWELVYPRYEALYDARLIFDWNLCDWFCVRVLGAAIQLHGEDCARRLASWKDAAYLWKARSALVAFVNVASVPQYSSHIFDAAGVLIRREERFAKTAVGWVLHDVSKYDSGLVESFVQRHIADFSKESLSNALKYVNPQKKQHYLNMLKTG